LSPKRKEEKERERERKRERGGYQMEGGRR
jgi:hypothetical protein